MDAGDKNEDHEERSVSLPSLPEPIRGKQWNFEKMMQIVRIYSSNLGTNSKKVSLPIGKGGADTTANKLVALKNLRYIKRFKSKESVESHSISKNSLRSSFKGGNLGPLPPLKLPCLKEPTQFSLQKNNSKLRLNMMPKIIDIRTSADSKSPKDSALIRKNYNLMVKQRLKEIMRKKKKTDEKTVMESAISKLKDINSSDLERKFSSLLRKLDHIKDHIKEPRKFNQKVRFATEDQVYEP